MKAPSRHSILFCIYSHNHWGGIEVWLRQMLDAFRDADWKVMLAIAKGKHHNNPKALAEAIAEKDWIELDGRVGTVSGRIQAVCKVLARLRPEIVVPLGLADVPRAVRTQRSRGHTTRLMLPMHAMNPLLFSDALALDGITDLCVGVNPLQQRLLRARGYRGDLSTIENGAPSVDASFGRRGRDRRPVRLLFVGRFEQTTKRVLDAVDLAVELRRREIPFVFRLAGDGPDRAELEMRVRDAYLGDTFDLLGVVTPESLLGEVLPSADCLLVFSRTEAGPLAPLEAMSRGVVPIAAAFPGLRSLSWFREGETALSFPCAQMDLAADAVQALATNPNTLSAMALAATETARRLSWAHCRARWVESARSVVASKAPVATSLDGPASDPWSPAGRLERLGAPAWAADLTRRALRRFPDLADGWAEWPGTFSFIQDCDQTRMLNDLRALEDDL